MIRPFRWAAMAVLLVAGVAHAGARDQLAAFTKGLKGLEGGFSQQVFDTNGKRKESSSGKVALSTPNLFRWEYVKPYPQLIVADGKKVWVFDPDLEQVTVRPQGSEEQNSPLTALLDPARLDRDFIVRETGEQGGLSWMELKPKSADNAAFQTAKLGFSAQGLMKMSVVDTLGQRTELAFSGWKRNPAFKAGTFTYKPAPGVDVVGEN